MARKRGFFAELQHQSQQAQKRKEQDARQAFRDQQAAQRQHEQALREYERLQAQVAKASAAEQKRLEAEAKQALLAARAAEVDERNAALANVYSEIDGLLAATLAVDDFVDLEQLRQKAEHPPFPHPELEWAIPAPPPFVAPPPPVWVEPPATGGLFGKKKHAERVAEARIAYQQSHAHWQSEVVRLQNEHAQIVAAHPQAEEQRMARLEEARRVYAAECAVRDQEAAGANVELDELISGLAYGVDSAVQEYVTIVLANSTYPDGFPVTYEHSFDASSRELTLSVSVPQPSAIPSLKAYKYTKATDEIAATALPAKEQKDRYSNAILQVTLRTLHEVFEADRAGHIRTVAATVGTTALNPATGRDEYVPLAMVAADRDQFLGLGLDKVVPAATLKHLGGVISKNPFDLVAIDTGRGVRGR